jgi:hypothetical protein
MIEEVIYISDFNVKLDGTIAVRKTTDVVKDGAVIASSYWRTVLQVNDPAADEVLGVDGYYRTLASDAWAMVPAPVVADEPAEEVLLTHLLKEARSKLSLGKIKPNGTSTTTLGCFEAARGEPTNAIR